MMYRLAFAFTIALSAIAPLRADDQSDFTRIYNQARKLQADDKFAESAEAFEKALALAKKLFGPNHADTGGVMGNLAAVYETLGEYAKALPLYVDSLKIAEDKFGKNHEITGSAVNNLAEVYRRTGDYSKAEPLYLRSIAISEKANGKDHPETAKSLVNLGQLYSAMGQIGRVEKLMLRALEICEAKLGKDDALTGVMVNGLASLYEELGQYSKAEAFSKRALAISERANGRDHLETSTSLNNLAGLLNTLGRIDESEKLYRRALAIREKKLGEDHPAVADTLNGLALLYKQQGKFAKAEPLYMRALKIRTVKLGTDHPETVETVNNVALMLAAGQHPHRAEPQLKWVLQVHENRFGKDHPTTAMAANNLAGMYVDMKKYDLAGPLFERALTIQEATYGKIHPHVSLTLNNLAILAAIRGDWEASGKFRERNRRAVRAFVADVLPGLSERDQERFLKENDEDRFHQALSHGLERKAESADRALSAGWLINGKSVGVQAQAERSLLERDRRDPKAASIVQMLQDTRRRLAAATLETLGPGPVDRQRELTLLATKANTLSRQLAAINGGVPRAPAWVELDRVRAALPSDGVLIEIARFDRKKVASSPHADRSLGGRYAAWIIPAKGDVTIVDLGPADAIDAAIQTVRKQLTEAPKLIADKGEPAAEKAIRPALDALSKLVLEPMLPTIRNSKKWVVSPDGLLWLAPWSALTIGDKYVVESFDVRFVNSGRDLVNVAAKVKGSAPLILADPDYDLGLADADRELRKLVAGDRPEARSLSRDFRLGNVQRLKGTADEAEAVAPRLQQYAGQEPRIMTGSKALVGVFKAAKNPRVVLLSTHGYFLEDEVIAARATPFVDEGPVAGKVAENPLLRCGLLLAGCNNASGAKPGQDNGVLTGLEILGTDLRGTELVVLSACETGLGDVRNGEGVAGLRQAFQLAGAESVVATLWQIPDLPSAQLMTAFFDGLAAGSNRDAALSAAQREMVAKRRDRFGAAHPFYWAAYTYTGAK